MNDEIVTQRTSFEPPQPRGLGWSITFALLVHVLLIAMLAFGLHWRNQAQDQAIAAELWSATPQVAAPPPPPPPPPQPQPQPNVQPQPQPVPQVDDTAQREAEIALEQKKREEEAARKAELERQRQEAAEKAKAEQEAKAKADAAKKAAEKASADKVAAQQKAAQQKAQADAKADAARRQDQMRRLNAMAGADATDAPTTGQGKTSNGKARRDSGPSGGYGARIRAAVRPNIVYLDPDKLRGNPKTTVQVWIAPDGTITDRKITQSSGVPSWDAAVLRALAQTHVLPRDVDGRVFSPMTLDFYPRD
jgi:colicin import membrane protein